MKKQLSITGGGFASFWSAVSTILQSLEILAINLITGQNNKIGNFLTPINNNPALNDTGSSPDQINNNLEHKAGSLPLEEIHGSLTSYKDWIDEDTSQGGEFLDDTLRMKDQSWGLQK